jgi:acetyl esterase
MKDYDIDEELRFLKPLRFTRYTKKRRFIANFIIALSNFFVLPHKNIKKSTFILRGYEHHKVKVYFFRKRKDDSIKPALLYLHGGGFQMRGTPVHLKIIHDLIKSADYKVIYLKYHLLPKYPFPVALEETYHALQWIKEHQKFLKIDGSQIAVAGDSAGGNLACGVTLLSRDRKGPIVKRLMMMYPVLDATLSTQSMSEFSDTPMWNSNLNRSMWATYLKNGDYGMLKYASPLQADLHDMPITYIETAEFDCLRDEGIQFGDKLKVLGNQVVEFHTKNTVHGYDAVFFSNLVKEMKLKRTSFLKGELDEKNNNGFVESKTNI